MVIFFRINYTYDTCGHTCYMFTPLVIIVHLNVTRLFFEWMYIEKHIMYSITWLRYRLLLFKKKEISLNYWRGPHVKNKKINYYHPSFCHIISTNVWASATHFTRSFVVGINVYGAYIHYCGLGYYSTWFLVVYERIAIICVVGIFEFQKKINK